MDNEYLKRIYGLLESGATLGTGAVSGLVGMPYGLYKGVTSGAYGTPEAPRIAAREAQQFMERNTYQPRTAEGQANLQQLAGLLEASKLPPVMPEASLLAAIPKQAYAAQAERAGMAAEKAIAPVVTRTMERGGLPAQLLGDLSQGSIRPMDVWHGSPHGPFGSFDPQKIGTGEGAQVYSIGHYLGEARGTGEEYRKNLSNPDVVLKTGERISTPAVGSAEDVAKAWLEEAFTNKDKQPFDTAINKITRLRNSANNPKQFDDAVDVLKQWKDEGATIDEGGYLYKVDLPDSAIAKMVEWETPLSEMDSKLASVIEPLQKQLMSGPNPSLFKNARSVGDVIQYANATGLNPHESLKAAGYPGIKYLDEQSRAAGKGTRNFVVFPGNEDLLKIKEINDKPYEQWFPKTNLLETAEPSQVSSLQDIQNKFKDVALDVYENKGTINLSRIVVPKEMRSTGIGSSVMNDLVEYADATGQKIALTPSDSFGGNVKRLKDFYKEFGFVENKGKNKDFSTMESMIRQPSVIDEKKLRSNLLD